MCPQKQIQFTRDVNGVLSSVLKLTNQHDVHMAFKVNILQKYSNSYAILISDEDHCTVKVQGQIICCTISASLVNVAGADAKCCRVDCVDVMCALQHLSTAETHSIRIEYGTEEHCSRGSGR